jgi:shikimate dehydrogenase
MIDGETKVHCLYGFPVGHSMSPIIFNNTFEKMNVNRTYVPFSVKPERLKEAVGAASVLGIEGFNVTMPHKTRIVELLDELENSARETGAVNTVSRLPRGLLGHNTDGEGAVRAIKAHGLDPKGRKILVLGGGGAARAVVRTLAREADITVLSRDPLQARNIVDRTRGHGRVSSGPLAKGSFEESVATANLLVNATPVQTTSLIRTLNITSSKLPPGLWVFDLAYDQPLETLPAGMKRISALEMLVQQAALSYEIWMHKPAPFELMRSILVKHIGRDWK